MTEKHCHVSLLYPLQLESVRTDTVQTLEARASAAQSAAETTAARKLDTEVAALRQQVSRQRFPLSAACSFDTFFLGAERRGKAGAHGF